LNPWTAIASGSISAASVGWIAFGSAMTHRGATTISSAIPPSRAMP
jgi:hypothetical protein